MIDVTQEVFEVHECICAVSSCVTRALQRHHVWHMRRLEFKGAFVDLRDACELCGNVVGGKSLVFLSLSFRVSMSLVSNVFSGVSDHPHRAAGARCEAVKEQLASFGRAVVRCSERQWSQISACDEQPVEKMCSQSA